MKKLCAIFFSLALANPAYCKPDESKHIEWIRKVFQAKHGVPKDLTFEESYGSLVTIKREGQLIGYYIQSSVWEPILMPKLDLSKVTRISYGNNSKGLADTFSITDESVLRLWCSIYKTQTEKERRFGHFIPLVKEAGFKKSKGEIGFGSVTFSSTGLRFFAGDKLILELKGSLHESPDIESGMKNHALSNLVINEMRKFERIRKEKEAKSQKLKNAKEPVKYPDPFE